MSNSTSSVTSPANALADAYAQVPTQQAQIPQQTLSQQDFLQLLVAQLSAQDPMNPVSDTEFIGQMAQFSTLQQTQTMQQNVATLQASNLLGKQVDVQPSSGSVVSGTVDAIAFQNGVPALEINGQFYTMSQVLSVAGAPQPAGAPPS